MTVRNLRMFFSDDHSAPQECRFIDIITKPSFGWVEHCYDTFESPRIGFELLSSDINFTEDVTDPGQPSDANSWGLIHALAALARRDHAAYGCDLPLAWEVRSASPEAYRGDPAAIRAYGLLRSMAASPLAGESLEDCIWREHRERSQPPPGLAFEAWRAQGLTKIFAEDLAAHQARGTDAVRACERLLPQWRDRFRQAAAQGRVRICESFNAVRRALPRGGTLTSDRSDPVGLPLMAEDGGVKERLNLFSVFADVVHHGPDQSDVLDLDVPFREIRIPGQPGEAFSVRQWLEDLGRAAHVLVNSVSPDTRFALVLHDVFERMPTDPRDGHDEAWASGNPLREYMGRHGFAVERAMVLCALVFHRTLEGHDDVSHGALVRRYSLATNPQSWSRPIRETPSLFPQIGGPEEVAAELQQALRGRPHRLGRQGDWMLRGLAKWIAETADSQLPRNWRASLSTYTPALDVDGAPVSR